MRLRRGASGPKSPLFQAAPLKAIAWMSSCKIFMKRLKDVYRWLEFRQDIHRQTYLVISGCAPWRRPESILPMVVMDSGLARGACHRAGRRPDPLARDPKRRRVLTVADHMNNAARELADQPAQRQRRRDKPHPRLGPPQ